MGDHDGGAGEVQQCLFQRAQGFHVEVVGRFVEQQHVGTLLERQRQVQAATLTTGQILDELLLVAALEVEAADVAARRHLVVADLDHVESVGHRFPHGLAAVQVVAALIHAGQLHGIADLDAARIRGFLAHDHPEQGRLTGAVTTDHADDGALGHAEAQVVDQHAVAVALGHVLELDDLVAQARAGRDVDFVGLGALLEFLRLHLLEALQAGLGLGLAGLGALAHPLQLFLHGFFVGRLLLGLLGQTLGLGFQPAGVVALVRDAGAAVELENPAGDVVEEVAVVGDGHYGAREVMEEPLQPGDRVGVQVVGRFVQQQHVGSRQQQTTQRHATLLAAGQVLDLGVPRRQAQGVGGDFQLALQVVTVGRLQDGLQLGLLGSQGVEIGVRLGVGGVHLIQARLGVLDLADGFFHNVANGLARVELWLLWQVADIDPRHGAGFAVELGVDAGHDAQQGGLTGAVQAEHADLGAREERQGNVLEDLTLRRNDLAQPVHGVDVLSHGNRCP